MSNGHKSEDLAGAADAMFPKPIANAKAQIVAIFFNQITS